MQTIGVSSCLSAAAVLAATTVSSSWWYVLRSECPTTTNVQPSLARKAPLTSPV